MITPAVHSRLNLGPQSLPSLACKDHESEQARDLRTEVESKRSRQLQKRTSARIRRCFHHHLELKTSDSWDQAHAPVRILNLNKNFIEDVTNFATLSCCTIHRAYAVIMRQMRLQELGSENVYPIPDTNLVVTSCSDRTLSAARMRKGCSVDLQGVALCQLQTCKRRHQVGAHRDASARRPYDLLDVLAMEASATNWYLPRPRNIFVFPSIGPNT